MYFPTRSASGFVLARTRLWRLKPVCRQERMRSAHSGLSSSLRTSIARTSRAKTPAPGRPVFPRYFSLNLTVTVKSAFTAFPSRISGS